MDLAALAATIVHHLLDTTCGAFCSLAGVYLMINLDLARLVHDGVAEFMPRQQGALPRSNLTGARDQSELWIEYTSPASQDRIAGRPATKASKVDPGGYRKGMLQSRAPFEFARAENHALRHCRYNPSEALRESRSTPHI